jgi:hypothetical protein
MKEKARVIRSSVDFVPSYNLYDRTNLSPKALEDLEPYGFSVSSEMGVMYRYSRIKTTQVSYKKHLFEVSTPYEFYGELGKRIRPMTNQEIVDFLKEVEPQVNKTFGEYKDKLRPLLEEAKEEFKRLNKLSNASQRSSLKPRPAY